MGTKYEVEVPKGFYQMLDILRAVSGGKRQAQKGTTPRDGWVSDGGNQNTLLMQSGRGLDSFGFIADVQRKDGAAG